MAMIRGAVVLLVVGGLSAGGLAAAGASTPLGSAGAHAYPEGAPPGFTGGFGESSCDACHFGGALNEPPGTLLVDGLPDVYAAGQSYLLTVRLQRPGMKVGGFQIASRLEEDGTQAGTLKVPPEEEGRVVIAESNGVQYAFQAASGANPDGGDEARWTLAWTAPAGGGAVLLHVSAAAGDGDGSAMGDHVFTAEARLPGKTR